MSVTTEGEPISETIAGITLIPVDSLKDSSGHAITLDEYMELTAATIKATYFDGGSPFVYPGLGLTENEFVSFLDGLDEVIKELYAEPGSTDRRQSWILKLGLTGDEPGAEEKTGDTQS